MSAQEKWRRAQLVVASLGIPDRFADWKVEDFDPWYCWLESNWRERLPVYGGNSAEMIIAEAVIACPDLSPTKLARAMDELYPGRTDTFEWIISTELSAIQAPITVPGGSVADFGELSIRAWAKDALPCFAVNDRRGTTLLQNCLPEGHAPQNLFNGGTGNSGDTAFIVVWVPPSAVITSASNSFTTTDLGWTLFQGSTTSRYWAEFSNLGGTFHCDFSPVNMVCDLLSASTTSVTT